MYNLRRPQPGEPWCPSLMPPVLRVVCGSEASIEITYRTRSGMWHELLLGLALMLVIEGILPFLSPATLRQAFMSLAQMDDRSLRLSGLLSMVIGVILLYAAR